MDKNQNFFDPYNFNMQNQHMGNIPNVPPPDMPPIMDMQNVVSPTMYYEQQYVYYRYLTQMLEYKTKLKEYEQANREKK